METLEPQLVASGIEFDGKRISIVYSLPTEKTATDCLIIAHSVKGSMNSSLISRLHSQLATRGFLTVKFNFPYAEGRWRLLRRPDRKNVLVESYRRVIEEVRRSEWKPKNLFLGGFSLGAAVASHAVADGPGVPEVRGLFFLGYPIHLPKKPDRVGERHLDRISLPMLFISGTKDVYAHPDVMESTVERLGPRAQVHWVEGADHGFKKVSKSHANTLGEIVEAVMKWANGVGLPGSSDLMGR